MTGYKAVEPEPAETPEETRQHIEDQRAYLDAMADNQRHANEEASRIASGEEPASPTPAAKSSSKSH